MNDLGASVLFLCLLLLLDVLNSRVTAQRSALSPYASSELSVFVYTPAGLYNVGVYCLLCSAVSQELSGRWFSSHFKGFRFQDTLGWSWCCFQFRCALNFLLLLCFWTWTHRYFTCWIWMSLPLQHPRLCSLCFLHGRHRESLQWEVQGAADQWLFLDSSPWWAGPQTEVSPNPGLFKVSHVSVPPTQQQWDMFVSWQQHNCVFSFLQTWYVCRRWSCRRLQVVGSVSRWDADLHQVVSSDGRSCSFCQRPAVLHQDLQQVTHMNQAYNMIQQNSALARDIKCCIWGKNETHNVDPLSWQMMLGMVHWQDLSWLSSWPIHLCSRLISCFVSAKKNMTEKSSFAAILLFIISFTEYLMPVYVTLITFFPTMLKISHPPLI